MVAGASRSVHGGLTLVQLLEIVVLVVIIIVIIVIIIVLLQRWGAGNFGMLIWADGPDSYLPLVPEHKCQKLVCVGG